MKNRIFLLVLSTQLAGCMVGANDEIGLASSLRGMGSVDWSKQSITQPSDISPVFKEGTSAGMYSYNGGANVYVDEDENGKPVFIVEGDVENRGSDYTYASKKISYDKDGFVNISFNEPQQYQGCRNCRAVSNGSVNTSSGKSSLILGGNATNLTYTDFGMFKTYNNGQTYYTPVVMDTFDPANNIYINVGDNVKFTGKTVAVLNGETDLRGNVNLTLKYNNNGPKADLEIDFDKYKKFTGQDLEINGSTINGTMRGGLLFNSNVGYYGNGNGLATEINGMYTLDNPYTNDYIDGAFGVKSNNGVEVSYGCWECK